MATTSREVRELVGTVTYVPVCATRVTVDSTVTKSGVSLGAIFFTVDEAREVAKMLLVAAEKAESFVKEAAKITFYALPAHENPIVTPVAGLHDEVRKVARETVKVVLHTSSAYEPPVVTPVANLHDKLAEVCVPKQEEQVAPKNCSACAYSGMEPADMDLTCMHPGAGSVGLHIRREPPDFPFCKNFSEFRQHPSRTPTGDLKSFTDREKSD
jgi:hypothetical protein